MGGQRVGPRQGRGHHRVCLLGEVGDLGGGEGQRPVGPARPMVGTGPNPHGKQNTSVKKIGSWWKELRRGCKQSVSIVFDDARGSEFYPTAYLEVKGPLLVTTQRANCALSPNYEPGGPKSAAFPNKTLRGGILFRTEAGSKSARPPPPPSPWGWRTPGHGGYTKGFPLGRVRV